MTRVRTSYAQHLTDATQKSLIVPEFLAALTANESGGNHQAQRFEPGVYRRLEDVAAGRLASYGGITKSMLEKEITKAQSAHQQDSSAVPEGSADRKPAMPTSSQGAAQANTPQKPTAADLAATPSTPDFADDFIRRLSTSWGLTQIMGYHLLGRADPIERLLEPAFHYRMAVELLEEFALRHHLDPARDFEALFRCWNTGRPDGQTADPRYAENGRRRLDLYRQLALKDRPPAGQEPAAAQKA